MKNNKNIVKLTDIGKQQCCDKADVNHTFESENYLHTYERYFELLRDENINILELGVRDGSSLRIWREYFSKANILGIDIDPNCLNQDFGGCKVEIISQDDDVRLNEISEQVKGWDIIIDDASHLNELTKKSFEILWKHVKPKGYYIIEDLKVSYSDLSNRPEKWNSLHFNDANYSRNNDRTVLNDLFFKLIKDMDMGVGNIRNVSFYNQIVIIQKI